MDRFRAMSVFVAIANAGSLSAAARQLGEPLTNVSRLLSQLENSLGLTLVERTTRRLALTEAGRHYLKACRRILEDLSSTEQALVGAANDLSGEISVTAPVGLGRLHVLPIVSRFLKSNPGIHVRLTLLDRIVDLMAEEADVAVRVGRMKDSELRASRVGTLRLVVCASPDYLEHRGTPSTVSALSQHDCITFAELPGGSRWLFTSRRNGRHAARVHSRLNVNTADAAVAAATEGIGVVRVLSYQARAAIEARLLVPVLERFEDGSIPVNLVYRPPRLEHTRIRKFVSFLGQELRSRLDER
ncbi:MAG: LysR family transcriptional regulator [Hyphomicrobium sp.]|jgi:DNA-binding transcriptional LysR family regulator|nr:LysR family transcriptional regulator [Hyphomicrobium sp.]